ncbi:MAG: pilus assembly protein PilM [Syntrophaceae bacterium]|nr:pilus assembly protein PilM [Syntrophaceae bacterium]
MAKYILGLDVGTSSLKAVLLEAGLRGGMRIAAWEKVDIAGPGGLREALRRLQEIPILAVPSCHTALAAKHFSFRNVKLPFKDRKKIGQTLPFELDGQIPHPVESVLIDFAVLRQEQGSELFAAVIPKADVEERISLLSDYGFDAETIDIDAVPVAARLMTAAPAESLHLLLDVGASETAGVLFRDGRILQVRSFPFGGDHITRALSGALGIPFSDAEARKRRGETGPAEEEITEACGKFFASLKNTIGSLRMAGIVREEPDTVWLTGGGALYRKLAEDLSRALAVPVERVNVTQLAGIKPVGGSDAGWDSMIMNGALALALRPVSKGPGFDFRQGNGRRRPVSFKLDLGIDLKWAGAVAALILLLAGADLTLSHYADKARLDQLKAEAAALVQQNFPDVQRVVDPARQFRAKIDDAKRLAAATRGAAPGDAALLVLKDLSEKVPETAELLLTSLVLDGDRIEIRAEASTPEAAESIRKALEATGRYAGVTVNVAGTRQGGRVELELRAAMARKP